MLCPKCHFNNQEQAQFCSQCGTRLPAAPQTWPANPEQAAGAGAQATPVGPNEDRLRSAYAPPEGGNFYHSLEEQGAQRGTGGAADSGRIPQSNNPYADYTPAPPYRSVAGAQPYARGDRSPGRPGQPPVYGSGYPDDFAGDQYGGADAYYEDPVYDDYDPEPYRKKTNKNRSGQVILTVALGVVAVAVVIGIIFVVRNLLSDPPLRQESPTVTGSAAELTQTRPTEMTTQMTLPSASPTYTRPSTSLTPSTAASQLPSSSVIAAGSVTVNASYVIRSGPGTSYGRIGLLSSGGTIKIVDEVQGEAVDGIGSTWYVVEYNGGTAYMIKDPGSQTVRP